MAITFDPAKSERNRVARGLPFDKAGRFVWSTSRIGLAKTQEPTAVRWSAIGEIDGIVHVVIFTIEGSDTRIISLRRAKKKERNAWSAARGRR